MPTTLAWGLPVEVDVFRAHLDAYLRTLSTVNTLKLCYKSGERVALTKLPPELVLCIADHVVLGERERLLTQWKRDFQCFQLLCEPDDHRVKSSIQKLKEKSFAGGNKTCINARGEELELDIYMRTSSSEEELTDGDTPKWLDVHEDRRKRWQMRPPFYNRLSSKYKGITHKLLGVDVWLEDISVYDLRLHSWWEMMASTAPGHSRAQSTVAWLFSPLTESFDMELGVPSAAPAVSASTRRRFDRALAILGLQPCLHPSQQSLISDVNGADWPKPIALIRNSKGWSFGIWDEQGSNNSSQHVIFNAVPTTQLVQRSIWNTLGPARLKS